MSNTIRRDALDIEGLRRAKRTAVRAMDAENKEQKEQGK